MSSVPPNKRKRDDEPTDTSTNPKIRTEDLTGFSWSRKVKEMDYAKLLQYIPSLPERTQYFDTGVLLGAVLDPGTYSAGFLSVWREIRGSKELFYNFYDHPPDSLNRPACIPPLSTFEYKLRASLTYETLLEKAIACQKRDESRARLTLEVANKLLDYLVLCCLQCSKEDMDRYLPNHVDSFQLAEEVIRSHAEPSGSADGPSSASPSKGPQPKAGLLPEGSAKDLNYDRLVEEMVVTSSSELDPETQWLNIHGNQQAKRVLRSQMVRSLRRGKKVNNILLFGPPGTGKTMMLRCAGRLASWTIIEITQNVILQTYQGQSEKMIAAVFKKAAQCQPSCIVIDEADYLFARRSQNQSERAMSIRCCLLKAMSDVMDDKSMRVMFIATTNAPENFDDSFMRRFPYRLYVKLPDQGALLAIMQQQLARYRLDDDVTNKRLHGLSCELAKKQTLSGYDITRALEIELQSLIHMWWDDAKYFREKTLDNGDRVLLPCSSGEAGAFRCRAEELTEDQDRRLMERKVSMEDIEYIVRGTVSINTRKTIQWFDKYNEDKGTRISKA